MSEAIPTLLPAVALLLILEGVPYFATPQNAQKFLRYVAERPVWVLRLFGFVLIVSGVFALWLAQDLRTT